MPDLDPEDEKLVTLARSALPRSLGAAAGAAVRDDIGRTYAAAAVDTGALRIGALALAVASAVSSGARRFEAAAYVGGEPGEDEVRALESFGPVPLHVVA